MKKIPFLLLLATVVLFTACGEDSKKAASEITAKTVNEASNADDAEEAMKKAAELTEKVAEEKAEEMAEAAKPAVNDASDTAQDTLKDAKTAIHDASAPNKD